MTKTAEPNGLPLRQAVTRYQFPRPDDPAEMSAAELVQRYCDVAVGFDVPFRFQFDPEDCVFYVVSEADLSGDAAERIPYYAQFRIGDDVPFMSDLSTGGQFFDDICAKMQTLHTLLEGSLNAPWNAERLRVYGRISNPLGEFSVISSDAFALFTVCDWEKGMAKADATTLYAVRIEFVQYPQMLRQSAEPHLASAPLATIHEVLLKLHQFAASEQIASPNQNEMPRLVNKLLARRGLAAPVGRIRTLAADHRYDRYELGVGVSAASKGVQPASALEGKLANLKW